MSTLPRYRQDLADNPVQRHERHHLRRERMSWFSRGLYAITLFAMLAPILWGFNVYFYSTLEASVIMLILLNIVMIFATEMRIITDAAESIRREFQGRTWTLLILTGVDTWRLILGKWLGVIRGHKRSIAFLYILRLMTFIWGMGYYRLERSGLDLNYWDRTSTARLWDLSFDLSVIPTVMFIMAVYFALEIMLVAALPLALSLFRKSRKGAAWAALGLRILVPVAFAFSIGFIFGELPYALGLVERWRLVYPDTVDTALFSIMFVLMDNGFLMSAFHVDSGAINDFNQGNDALWSIFVTVQILGIGLYLLWIWIMLRLAKFAAHRMNVSAPGFEPKIKTKHPNRYKLQSVPHADIPSKLPIRTVPKVTVYRCEVIRYDRGSAQLDIAIYKQNATSATQAIRFTGVSYFTGMMRWRTTDIRVEKDTHLESFSNQQQIDYDRLSVDSKLYEMRSMDSPVYVIATSVQTQQLAESSR